MVTAIILGILVLIGTLYRYTYVLEWFIAPNGIKRNEISSRGFWWDNHYCFSCDNFITNCECHEDHDDDTLYDEESEKDDYDDIDNEEY